MDATGLFGESAGFAEKHEKWARIWFHALVRFHRIDEPATWKFDQQHVIDFLRAKLKDGMPAWKRLKIVEGLIFYLERVRKYPNVHEEFKLQFLFASAKFSRDSRTGKRHQPARSIGVSVVRKMTGGFPFAAHLSSLSR